MERGLWISADGERLGRQLSYARGFVKEAASDFGVDSDAIDSVALAVHEAIANAIEHGQPCCRGGVGMIELRARHEDGCAVFMVCDCGQFERPDLSRGLLDEGGRGIPLMAALVDDVRLMPNADGTVVRLEKRLAEAA